MLGALPFVTVGQQHHEPTHSAPLHVGRGDELIDDDLSAVHEITKLGLPENERAGICEGIAIFESEYGGFRKQTVVDLEASL